MDTAFLSGCALGMKTWTAAWTAIGEPCCVMFDIAVTTVSHKKAGTWAISHCQFAFSWQCTVILSSEINYCSQIFVVPFGDFFLFWDKGHVPPLHSPLPPRLGGGTAFKKKR